MNLSKGVGKVTCKAGMKCEMVVYVLLGSLLIRIIGERRLFLKSCGIQVDWQMASQQEDFGSSTTNLTIRKKCHKPSKKFSGTCQVPVGPYPSRLCVPVPNSGLSITQFLLELLLL